MGAVDDVRTNRTHWDAFSAAYQEGAAPQLNVKELAWGVFGIPEDELKVLGDVAGKDILELGCGAAQWSIFLSRRGARPVGLDLSSEQLRHGRDLMVRLGATVPVVQASATSTPFADASFDVVFCDYGAMSFADPDLTVPEAARVLRSGGVFAFMTMTPLFMLCFDPATDEVDERLHADYFGMRRFETIGSEAGAFVEYVLPYGDWIRLFRRHGFVVEDLIEPQAPAWATTNYYRTETEVAWQRRWPAEQIWKLRKAAA